MIFVQINTRQKTDQNTDYANRLLGISSMEITSPANPLTPIIQIKLSY